MPGFDGTGPAGMGPRTGGCRGFCHPQGYDFQRFGAGREADHGEAEEAVHGAAEEAGDILTDSNGLLNFTENMFL